MNYNISDHPSVIEMKLAEEPFRLIKIGEKTVELRLFDEKRRRLAVGDTIQFICSEGANDHIRTEVVALHQFDSFAELFATELFSKCGCGTMRLKDAVDSMRKYYSEEEERKYGVLGIEVKVISLK